MPWSLDDEAAEPIFRQAVELGITFWDTANIYGLGTSEEIIGRAIKRYTRREDVVLATKLFMPMDDGPGGCRAVPQSGHGADRRFTDPPRHRLRRPLPDPPLRPRDPGRGDDGGAARRRQSRQGPLPRRLVDVGVAASPRCNTPPICTAGPGSSPCRTSTAWYRARKSARCSACSPIRASAAFRGARWPADSSPGRGATEPPAAARRTRTPTRRDARCSCDSDKAIVDAVAADRTGSRRVHGAGRHGVGAEEPRRRLPHRRRHQSAPPDGLPSPRSTSTLTDDEIKAAGRAIHAAAAHLLLVGNPRSPWLAEASADV